MLVRSSAIYRGFLFGDGILEAQFPEVVWRFSVKSGFVMLKSGGEDWRTWSFKSWRVRSILLATPDCQAPTLTLAKVTLSPWAALREIHGGLDDFIMRQNVVTKELQIIETAVETHVYLK